MRSATAGSAFSPPDRRPSVWFRFPGGRAMTESPASSGSSSSGNCIDAEPPRMRLWTTFAKSGHEAPGVHA